MGKSWNQIEVEGDVFIPFDYLDKTVGGGNLGRAEFQVCVKLSRGKISEFWVYPRQQRNDNCWHIKSGDKLFTISSYEGLDHTGAWMASWCDEHKCTSFSIYAPDHAKFLEIDYHGLTFWRTHSE